MKIFKVLLTPILMVILLQLSQTALCQKTINNPEDPALRQKVETNYALFNDNIVLKTYSKGLKGLNWLLKNWPEYNEGVFINGVKVFEAAIKEETDPQRKRMLKDSLLIVYDLRIKIFGHEKKNLDRKMSKYYKHFRNVPEKYPDMLKQYKKTLELNGKNMLPNNAFGYMDIIRRSKKGGADISDDEVLKVYDKIVEAMDQTEDGRAMIPKINGILSQMVTIDCDFIESKLGPKLKENPEDIGLAKMIIKFALSGNCLDSEVAYSAAKRITATNKDPGLLKFVGYRQRSNNQYSQAIKTFEEAMKSEETNAEKAEFLMEIANTYAIMKSYSNARAKYYEAIKLSPAVSKKAHGSIGNLYATSFKNCSKKQSKVEDYAIFIAAYDEYKLAGDTKKMAQMKKNFPSAEDIFSEGKQVGQAFQVGCWINKSVKLQKRP